jgi:hypothetical protein
MLCKTCMQHKEASAFYVSNQSRCKECVKQAVTAHRNANIERVRAYDKLRASMPHRVSARKEYAQTPEGRLAHQRALKASATRHPEHRKARIKFGNAVRDGRVIPWPVCALPDCDGKPQGHHPDYSRPLDVVWLCEEHHRQAHAIAKAA